MAARIRPVKALLVFIAVIAAIRLWDAFGVYLSQTVIAALVFLYAPLPHYLKNGPPAWMRIRDAKKTALTILLFSLAGAVVYFVFLRAPYAPAPPQQTASLSPSLAAYLLLLTALPEEVFFRGYLYDAFEEAGWPPVVSTALLFALAHIIIFPSPYRALTFFPGLVFGWGRKTSGAIFIPVAVHFIYNLLPFAPYIRP